MHTDVRPSISVRVRYGVSNLRLSFSGVSNLRLFFRRGHPCPLDTFLVYLEIKEDKNTAISSNKSFLMLFYNNCSSRFRTCHLLNKDRNLIAAWQLYDIWQTNFIWALPPPTSRTNAPATSDSIIFKLLNRGTSIDIPFNCVCFPDNL